MEGVPRAAFIFSIDIVYFRVYTCINSRKREETAMQFIRLNNMKHVNGMNPNADMLALLYPF